MKRKQLFMVACVMLLLILIASCGGGGRKRPRDDKSVANLSNSSSSTQNETARQDLCGNNNIDLGEECEETQITGECPAGRRCVKCKCIPD